MTEHSALTAFARLLAEEENPAKRSALLQRARLLAMQQAEESAFEPPVRSLGEYLDAEIAIPPVLVTPTIVVRGELTVTLGRAGKGKTTMNLNRMLKWACGRPFFEDFTDKEGEAYLKPSHPLKVLIIENEGAAGMFHRKMGLLLNNNDGLLSDEDREAIRENVFIWGEGGFSGLKLDDPARLSEVRAGLEKVEPDILFIEPFRGLWKGDENSSTDMAVVIDNLLAMATDYGCGVVLSHHERKSGAGEDGELMSAGRGSTVLEGAAAVMENFQAVKNGEYRELTWSKSRYLGPPFPARLKYSESTGWYDYVPIDAIEGSILVAIADSPEEAMSVSQLADALDEKPQKLRPMCKKLKDAGRLRSLASSSYAGGSTGVRYALASGDNDDNGGLPV